MNLADLHFAKLTCSRWRVIRDHTTTDVLLNENNPENQDAHVLATPTSASSTLSMTFTIGFSRYLLAKEFTKPVAAVKTAEPQNDASTPDVKSTHAAFSSAVSPH